MTHYDPVNAPEHYTSGSIECIEAIEAQLTPEEYRGFLKGNVAKYLWREKMKGGTQSLEKARWYPNACLLYTSPSPRDRTRSRMPSSA